MAEGTLYQQNDPAVIDWSGRISLDQIPGLLLFLATCWLGETRPKDVESNALSEAEKLLTAGEVAEHLHLPKSWLRIEERLGRIPRGRLRKYVRFRLSDVERTLGKKQRRRPEMRRFLAFPGDWMSVVTARHVPHPPP